MHVNLDFSHPIMPRSSLEGIKRKKNVIQKKTLKNIEQLDQKTQENRFKKNLRRLSEIKV